MEPGHEDREYEISQRESRLLQLASMEPGHEDREYMIGMVSPIVWAPPQWSPVMKTGNTYSRRRGRQGEGLASMEPGHEDREYDTRPRIGCSAPDASMEPGHEDREYWVQAMMISASS